MREYCFGTITAAHGMASASQAATCSLFQELVRLERRGEANSQHRSHAANGPARRTSRQALQELIDQSWTRMPQVTKKLNSNWLTRHLHEHRCLVHGLFAPPVLAKLRFVTTPEDADIGQKRAGPFTSLPLYLGIGAEGGKQLLVILGNPISEIVPRGGSSGEMCLPRHVTSIESWCLPLRHLLSAPMTRGWRFKLTFLLVCLWGSRQKDGRKVL